MGKAIGIEPSSGVLEDLINSGNLNTLKSKELRSSLSDWNSVLRKVEKQEARVLEYREGVAHIFMAGCPFRDLVNPILQIGKSEFTISCQNVLQNYQLENQLSIFMITSNALQVDHYTEIKKAINHILDLINEEIN